ncbi:MAG: AMP-binding protein [Planctomycetaceae bacterium]
MRELFCRLRRMRLLTFRGLFCLFRSIWRTGVTPLTLLKFAAGLHPESTALVDDRESVTYRDLLEQSENLAVVLQNRYGLRPGSKIALAVTNHAVAVRAIFACSGLGLHVYLVNAETRPDQLRALDAAFGFKFYIYEQPLAEYFSAAALAGKAIPCYQLNGVSVDELSREGRQDKQIVGRRYSGSIVVLTGGTTGVPKAAGRKPSILNFMPPFLALLTQLQLDRYQRIFIGTPIFHGFGLASLFLGVLHGAEVHLMQRFDAVQACQRIAAGRLELITVVPLMLQRLLKTQPDALGSLRCVISGGAMLSPTLARQCLDLHGPVLFNLYGTSEGGVAAIAGPSQLGLKPESIGREIRGVTVRILDSADREVSDGGVGRLCVRSSWTVSRSSWIETGDLCRRDSDGDLHLCGRVDDMIVSGGENVYPIELERVLEQHPEVSAVAVVGVCDEEFGQRLRAFVVPSAGAALDCGRLLSWLKPRVARHQMPSGVEFLGSLPVTEVGKVNKKALKGGSVCASEQL